MNGLLGSVDKGRASRTLRRAAAGAVALTLAMGLSACAGGDDGGGAPTSLKILIPSQADLLDPTRSSSIADAAILIALEPLIRYENDGSLEPNLATEFTQPDPSTYVFDIREGVEFWDGSPLTVEDVLFSLDLHAAEESTSLRAPVYADVASIEATGDQQVTIQLNNPDPQFLYGVAVTPIVSQAYYEANETVGTPETLNMGTGPYQYESFNPSRETVLTANEAYWGDEAAYEELVLTTVSDDATRLNGIQSGEFDVIYQIPIGQLSAFERVNGLEISDGPDLAVYKINFDMRTPPFNDPDLRRAVMLAVDREGLVQGALGGRATLAPTIVPQDLMSAVAGEDETAQRYAALAEQLTYDVEAARDAIAASDYPDGVAVDVSVLASHPTLSSVAQTLQQNLAEIGVELTINQVDDATYYEEVYFQHTTDGLSIDEFGGINPDPVMMPFYILNSAFSVESGGSGANLSDYNSPEVDSLILQSQELDVDDPARAGLIMDALELAQQDLPYVPLAFPDVYAGATDGLTLASFDTFWWMTRWPEEIQAR